MSRRVGLFGVLGAGNMGNDASMDAVLAYLATGHPDARISFFCMGPERLARRHGAPAVSLQWYEAHAGSATGLAAAGLKLLGKLLDPWRTLRWVGRQDVVIVPGMGVLETTTPTRAWAMPYSLFWLAVCARLLRRPLALVSIGANRPTDRATRWLFGVTAKLSSYRSYRDEQSRAAVRGMGVDVRADPVYPDLAFALPVPGDPAGDTGTVGVGLMAYQGGNDDRHRAERLRRDYTDAMVGFVGWLVADGRSVRLFHGDQEDEPILAAVLAAVAARNPGLAPGQLVSSPVTTFAELTDQLAAVDVVVAARYHNVIAALAAGTPTLAVGYAAKHRVLMAETDLEQFHLPAADVGFEALRERFIELDSQRVPVRRTVAEHNLDRRRRLGRQFDELSAVLFAGDGVPAASTEGR